MRSPVNPMRFSVEGIRHALYGAEASLAVGTTPSAAGLEVPVLLAFATIFLGLAALSVSRRE
ncbi:MAG: hypothetical protein ACXU86_13055 [Archangium sp.]